MMVIQLCICVVTSLCGSPNRTLDAGEMTGFELASVANLQPETAEEAKILIPSLDVSP